MGCTDVRIDSSLLFPSWWLFHPIDVSSRLPHPFMENFEDKVKAIIIERLGADADAIVPEASFANDLGADSLDIVELVMEFEKQFGISIPDEDAEKITTVGDAISYLKERAA